MRTGDTAPDVRLRDQSGEERSLSGFAGGGRLVLFFYPAAMTTGCTKESRHFRDLAAEFAAQHAVRVGISMDDVAKQATFAERNNLDYPLLSDPGGTVAKTFGVKRAVGFLKVKRTTFVLREDRQVIEVVSSEFDMNAHADRALQALAATPLRDAA